MPITGANLLSQYGITANYWKIGQLYIDYTNNTGFVNYLGYESELKAFTGNEPIKNIEVRLSGADITGVYGEAQFQETLTVTGASVIQYFDTLVGEIKDTALKPVSHFIEEYPSNNES